MICGWVTKRKRKAVGSVQRPAKRPATGTGSQPDFSPETSNADGEDDENQQSAEATEKEDKPATNDAVPICTPIAT